jgi:signal transduction histidine kinase/DNA-binding response OmpR family regulator
MQMGNILVVDDERSIRTTVKAFLELDGHSVETAEEAESAMAVLRSKSIDVVLTDIILPRISGVDLLRRIRDTKPDVQIIMMTGEPTLETAAESLRHGAVDYLQKPVGKNDILRAVRTALHVKHLNDEKLRLAEENRNYMNHLEQLVETRTHALAASEAALRHRAEELSILNRLARKVNESMTVDGSIQCGLSEIAKAVAPDLAVFFLRTGGDLVLRGTFPEQSEMEWQPQRFHTVGTCLCGLAVSEDRAIYSSDIRSDSRCTMEECRKAGFSSFAALPLRVGSETIGVLGIASLQQKDFIEHASFLEALANEMCIGLNKSLLYEREQQHAVELNASLSRIQEGEAERLMLLQHLQRSQRLEAIGTLASGIAHDFNNILAVVIGCTELALLRTPKESKSWQSLEMVLSAGHRAKDLVKQILAFSRQSEEERKPIQITHTVKEVLKFMRASLPATIEIREDIDSDSGTILADPVQIHQIVMNLCTNAHHAMSEKGGVLEVKLTSVNLGLGDGAVHPDLKPGPYVKVTVKDTGCGMDEATKVKIFDPYFTTKAKGVGTGLGLAVVHGLVQNHSGAITVESVPGKGSVFNLYFPAIQKEAVEETRIQETMPIGREHILLVDDEPVLLDMSREMLEYLGYSVETRTSSVEALALFSAQPNRFDLVITDMTMPFMTGDKLAMELLRIREDIPIVVCTGYSERIKDEQAKAMGIRAFVMKPILMAKMAKAIRDALENKLDA